ncbi:MAG TPA: alpha/beta hydrolase [Reyranella sp.]|nr:alpha/beta hydrolase [Reyranella sp.]
MASAIYRQYDQQALDAAYNNRAAVPAHPDILARWERDSRSARETTSCKLDLPYGPTARQKLDVFLPQGRAPRAGWPALVFYHGGYWQSLHKDSFAFLAPHVLSDGIALVTPTYELCPTVTMTALADQVRRSLAWLQDYGASLSLDPARLVVAGHSAGGHIAAMLAHASWPEPPPLIGALALSGLYDLEPIRLSYLNAALRMDQAEAQALSPIQHIRRHAPPLVLAMGGAELPGFHDQQRDYAAALAHAGAPALASLITADDDHFTIVDRMVDRNGPFWPVLCDLLRP